MKELIKKNQGHKAIDNSNLVQEFEHWIAQFEKNTLYADPQMKWIFDHASSEKGIAKCTSNCAAYEITLPNQ